MTFDVVPVSGQIVHPSTPESGDIQSPGQRCDDRRVSHIDIDLVSYAPDKESNALTELEDDFEVIVSGINTTLNDK